MALATTLLEAADLSAFQVATRIAAGTLNFQAFINDCQAILPNSGSVKERTVSNWLIPMQALQSQIASSLQLVNRFQMQIVEYLYRFCIGAHFASAVGVLRITSTQRTQLLAVWNARIGT
jgi:hypothetical protein